MCLDTSTTKFHYELLEPAVKLQDAHSVGSYLEPVTPHSTVLLHELIHLTSDSVGFDTPDFTSKVSLEYTA